MMHKFITGSDQGATDKIVHMPNFAFCKTEFLLVRQRFDASDTDSWSSRREERNSALGSIRRRRRLS